MSAYLDAMRRYATFRGRSSRSQFWLYTLILMILSLICMTIDISTGIGNEDMLPLTGLCNLVHLIPSIAILVRRIHDSDHSGFWVLPSFIPIVGLIFALLPSSAGANRFGQPRTGHTAKAVQGPFAADIGHVASVAAPGGRSTVDRLEQLANLRSSGAIDDAEFQRLKAEVMQPGAN